MRTLNSEESFPYFTIDNVTMIKGNSESRLYKLSGQRDYVQSLINIQVGKDFMQTGMTQRELTLCSHELLYVFLPRPRFRLGHIHAIEEVVAHQVVFCIACHVDSLIRKEGGETLWYSPFLYHAMNREVLCLLFNAQIKLPCICFPRMQAVRAERVDVSL